MFLLRPPWWRQFPGVASISAIEKENSVVRNMNLSSSSFCFPGSRSRAHLSHWHHWIRKSGSHLGPQHWLQGICIIFPICRRFKKFGRAVIPHKKPRWIPMARSKMFKNPPKYLVEQVGSFSPSFWDLYRTESPTMTNVLKCVPVWISVKKVLLKWWFSPTVLFRR